MEQLRLWSIWEYCVVKLFFGVTWATKEEFDDAIFEDLFNKFKSSRGSDRWNSYDYDPFENIRRRQQQQARKNRDIRIDLYLTLAQTLTVQKRTINIRGSGGTQTVDVDIPAGVSEGATVKYTGLGDDMFKTLPRGDLYIDIHVHPSPRFAIDGVNLIASIDIDCLRAIIGCEQEFTTVDDKTFLLTVPPGTQQGTKFKVAGQGMMNANQTRGDLILVANLKVPTNLSADQLNSIRELLNQ